MLVSEEDIDYMSEAVLSEFPEVKDGKAALVLMGHGTPVKAGEKGYDPKYGARPLRRAIQTNIEDELSRVILAEGYTEGDKISIGVTDGKVTFTKH